MAIQGGDDGFGRRTFSGGGGYIPGHMPRGVYMQTAGGQGDAPDTDVVPAALAVLPQELPTAPHGSDPENVMPASPANWQIGRLERIITAIDDMGVIGSSIIFVGLLASILFVANLYWRWL